MIVYDIKLICPETKEVIFHSAEPRPRLPDQRLFKRVPQPILIIETRDAQSEPKEIKKAA